MTNRKASSRVVFIGVLNPHGRSYQRKRAFEEIGCEVYAHSWRPAEAPLYERDSPLSDRVRLRLGFPRDLCRTNAEIVRAVDSFRPDILWIEKGLTVWPSTLRQMKRQYPTMQLVSYSEDDMYAWHNRSWFYTWGLKYYDWVLTTKSYNCRLQELPALGAKRVIFVDKSFDRHAHRPLPCTADDIARFGGDVGFIGTFEDERLGSLTYLAQNGIPVRVWGAGWPQRGGMLAGLTIEYRSLYGDEYAKGLCASKINLCFLRKCNRDLQTDRTMEIPACGAFMLAERTDEHLRLFTEGKEAAYFSSDQELLDKVRYYLAHEEERYAIALAGRRRCLTDGYSHHDRLRYALSVIAGTTPPPSRRDLTLFPSPGQERDVR